MNLFKKFIAWVGNIKTKERILTDLNPDVEENKIIKEQAKKIRSLEAQLSKVSADKKLKQVEKENIKQEKNLVKELLDNSNEIKRKKYKDAFPLITLMKEKKQIELVDGEDVKVFDIFYSFVVLSNGNIGIMGKSGEIWAEGKTLREIIWKPQSLKNQIRRKRITLPYDKNFKPMLDLGAIEVPEISYDEETDKWNVSEERLIPIRDMIIKRDKVIHSLRQDKEHHEQVIADLRNKIKDMELSKNSWSSQAKLSQSELSTALFNEREVNNQLGRLNRNLSVAIEQKELSDELKDKFEGALSRLIEELEDEKSRTIVRRVRDEVHQEIEWAKDKLPNEINTTVIEEPKPTHQLNPGQRMSK